MISVTHSGASTGAADRVSADIVTGYTPIAVVGYHEKTNTSVTYYNLYIDATKMLEVGWRCSTSVSNHNTEVYVLYVKN